MLKKLHKKNAAVINNEPDEGGRKLLCSNKGSMSSPSLDFLDTSAEDVTEDMILEYLARILSNIYLHQIHGHTRDKKGGDILPGINEGTS